jgi:menaquinone-dependent protoporphyrinogen oxidase
MAAILIVYGSVDGQGRRIAERIGEVVRRAGHTAEVRSYENATIGLVAASDAVVVGGSIRYGHYPTGLERFARDNRDLIEDRVNGFYSVSLSAGGPGAKPATAWGYVDEFIARTGWQPQRIASFAGALNYTRYNPLLRFVMRMIAGIAGGETDTSRDYEYTDWPAVERFAAELELQLRPAQAA